MKIDILRTLRPDDQVKKLGEQGSKFLLEEIMAGFSGYVVVTDCQTRIEDFGYKGTDERPAISIKTTLNIEHTYVLLDGKYVCEWGDNNNPLIHPMPEKPTKRPLREIREEQGRMVMRYNL